MSLTMPPVCSIPAAWSRALPVFASSALYTVCRVLATNLANPGQSRLCACTKTAPCSHAVPGLLLPAIRCSADC